MVAATLYVGVVIVLLLLLVVATLRIGRKLKMHSGVVWGIVGVWCVIAALIGQLVVIQPQQSSDVRNLTVESANFEEKPVTQFFLPIDVPLEEFPPSPADAGGCTSEQIDWLRKVGVERPPAYYITIRNSGESGALLTLDNMIADPLVREPVRRGFLFDCIAQGAGDLAVVKLDLDRGGPAVSLIDESRTKNFVFNLAAGEQETLEIRLSGERSLYSGQLVVDVASSEGKKSVAVPLPTKDGKFSHPGAGPAADFHVTVSVTKPGVFYCSVEPPGRSMVGPVKCTPRTIRAMVQKLWA